MREKLQLLGINMARRNNRRWLVGLTYLGLVVLWAVVGRFAGIHGEARAFTFVLLATALIVNTILFGGYGCWGLIKPFNSRALAGGSRNDERELRRRDRMHFYAYRVVVSVVLVGYFLSREPFMNPQVGNALLLGGLMLGLTLPQALLLWIEPDMEFEEPAAAGYPRG